MSTRLDTIVAYVEENKSVADIGTDHGITAMAVYDKKSPTKVLGTDISANSLQKLVDKIKGTNYKIETRVTDGIYDLEDFAPENIIISGMGGHLICEILERGEQVAKQASRLILQANNSLSHLRKYLFKNKYEIIDEKLAFDEDIYYDIIVCKYTGEEQNLYEKDYMYEYGKHIIQNKDPLLKGKLNKIANVSANIRSQIEDINTESSTKRIAEIDEERKIIEEILSCL